MDAGAGRAPDPSISTDPVRSGAEPAPQSRSPCRDFQAEGQSGGSGVLEACSLVKYLSYVIDVSRVINLAAAHPSSRPVPRAAPRRIVGGAVKRAPDEARSRVRAHTSLAEPSFLLISAPDCVALLKCKETKSVVTVVCGRGPEGADQDSGLDPISPVI